MNWFTHKPSSVGKYMFKVDNEVTKTDLKGIALVSLRIIYNPAGNHMFKLTIETLEQGVKYVQS